MAKRKKPRQPRQVPGTQDLTYELSDEDKALRKYKFLTEYYNDFILDPPAAARVPEGGAWAMITAPLPAMERGIDQKVRPGMVFWVQHVEGADKFGFRIDGSYKVICRTPWGDPCLWPYEYSVIETGKILELWQAKDLVFHPVVENLRFTDALFYLRSRGISLEDAMVMALGTMKGPVGWFDTVEHLKETCEAMSARVFMWGRRERITVA